MTQKHPITPPPELIEDWIKIAKPLSQRPPDPNVLATLAARWGADQELEACCEDITEIIAGIYADHVIEDWSQFVALLRDGRRPTEAVLALDAFDRLQAGNGTDEDWRLVRQKLERDCDD